VTRIPSHTIENAPDASRPVLERLIKVSPTGTLLNLHAQMAHSPALLAAYVSIRQATDQHGTLDLRVRSALMLATAGAVRSDYAVAVTSALALRAGWSQAEIPTLRDGQSVADDKIDSLVGVIREAAARAGRVSDMSWQRAQACGWSSEQLAEAFAYLGLTLFTAYFVSYAQTPVDLPAAAPAAPPAPGGRE
jgi:alkylhydroperoxidase family enzyme